MKEILDVIHKTIYQFFDVCGDDEEMPLTDKDKLLLKVNKAICNNLKALEQQPCEDAIPRSTAITLVNDVQTNDGFSDYKYYEYLYDHLDTMPSVNPQSKMGHWIEEDVLDGDVAYRCSECNELFWIESGTPKDNEYNFCPKCGCRMAESQESEE